MSSPGPLAHAPGEGAAAFLQCGAEQNGNLSPRPKDGGDLAPGQKAIQRLIVNQTSGFDLKQFGDATPSARNRGVLLGRCKAILRGNCRLDADGCPDRWWSAILGSADAHPRTAPTRFFFDGLCESLHVFI